MNCLCMLIHATATSCSPPLSRISSSAWTLLNPDCCTASVTSVNIWIRICFIPKRKRTASFPLSLTRQSRKRDHKAPVPLNTGTGALCVKKLFYNTFLSVFHYNSQQQFSCLMGFRLIHGLHSIQRIFRVVHISSSPSYGMEALLIPSDFDNRKSDGPTP